MLVSQSKHPRVNHALTLTLALSHKEREQPSQRAEAHSASPYARSGRTPSLSQRERAGEREKSPNVKVVRSRQWRKWSSS